MKDNLLKGLFGGAGIVSVEVVDQVASINPDQITSGASLIVQIILAIASLIAMFKKPKLK